MLFEVPAEPFNALAHAIARANRANQFGLSLKQQFISEYQEFWGVGGYDDINNQTGQPFFRANAPRFTVEQMQAILDAMPQATAVSVLTKAAAFVAHIVAEYPGTLPERFHTAAYDYTVGQNGITLTAIKAVWSNE